MNRKYTFIGSIIGIICLLLCAVTVFADGYKYTAYDSGKAIRIKYEPDNSTNTATITVAAAAVTLASPDVITGQGTNTLGAGLACTNVGDLIRNIQAITNATGFHPFEVHAWNALSADPVSNLFVAASADTLTHKTWEYHCAWDTSASTNYGVVASSMVGDSVLGGFTIDSVKGEPDGTGNLTLRVYEDGTVIWKKTVTSPYYVPALGGSLSNYAAITTVTLDQPVGIPADNGKTYLIRATRATSATTGGLGVLTTGD